MIALLPRSAEIERLIGLVATMYRLWCRLRNTVPGTECLQVALKRAFMMERHNATKKTVISVLLDMSNFYDRISLDKLCQRWLDSSHPATHAALAMQL